MKNIKIFRSAFCLLALMALVGLGIQNAKAIEDEVSMKLHVDKDSFLDPNYLFIDIEIKAPVNSFNAVMSVVNYDPNFLNLDEVVVNDSFCALSVQELPSAYEGREIIICGNPNNNASGTVSLASIRFKKINAGLTTIKLDDSQILTPDGLGSDLLFANEAHSVFIER